MTISTLHSVMSWVVIIANGLVGLWATAAHYMEPLRVRSLWIGIGVVQVLLFVEVALGVIRLQQLDTEAAGNHTFYGFLTLIAVAILYGYRNQVRHLHYLLYGGGSLFIMGLAIRAATIDATVVVG